MNMRSVNWQMNINKKYTVASRRIVKMLGTFGCPPVLDPLAVIRIIKNVGVSMAPYARCIVRTPKVELWMVRAYRKRQKYW